MSIYGSTCIRETQSLPRDIGVVDGRTAPAPIGRQATILRSRSLRIPVKEGRAAAPAPPACMLTFTDRDALYAEFQPLVRRLIRQYGDGVDSREDLIGEIYYRFCRLLDAFEPERGIPLKPYMVRQLAASVYTYARHQWRRQRRETALETDKGIAEAVHSEDPSRHWDDCVMLNQIRAGLPDALSQLSQRQRQVVVWRYYEARSFEEIAEWLSIRPATARSILRHGLHNIRHKLTQANLVYD